MNTLYFYKSLLREVRSYLGEPARLTRPAHLHINYPLGCYDTNVTLLTYLNNEIFSHELKILNYDELWENKKILDENQRFDWIKSIHGYRLVNIGWLADINLFDSMI